MKPGPLDPFGAQLKALREAAGFTQEELATIAGLSVHAISALERGERRRPQLETVRALSAALDLTPPVRDAFAASARTPTHGTATDELIRVGLPLAPTAIVGRERDLETLRQWLADPSARLITLVGPGGVGKTRLALELARSAHDEAACRVSFVALSGIQESALVAPAIAEALGLAAVTVTELPRRVRTVCGDRRTLLVLDNCEHLLGAAPLVADLLTAAASLQLLATSREPLRVRGERQYSVGPLALQPDGSVSLPDQARVPAVRLFVERVRDVQPDFRLTPVNGPTVSAICRRLDALPLALELAARWIKVLSVDHLLERLERDVLLAPSGPRDVAERQQTMNATVAWSYQLLDPGERRAFRRLGSLPGAFPIEAAAAVLAGRSGIDEGHDALAAAASLIEKSLLQRAESAVPTRPLYQMFETVRAYACLELDAANERDDAMEGLARYCTREASLAADALVGSAQVDWLNRVRDDLESYRGALAWLIEHGRAAEAADIAWGLLWFWVIRAHATEGLHWYGQILNLPSLPPAAESRALIGAAMSAYVQGELDRTRAALDRAVELARGECDRPAAAHAENLYGHMERALGNLEAAREHLARSVESFQALAIPWGAGSGLNGLAAIALLAGDVTQAEQLLDQANAVLRGAGPWFLTLGFDVRAMLALRRGEPDTAIVVLRECLTQIRDLRDSYAFVYALVPLFAAAALKGDDAWAARILGTLDAVAESTGVTVVDQSLVDLRRAAEPRLRSRLGQDRWTRAYAAGRLISIDALLGGMDRTTARLG